MSPMDDDAGDGNEATASVVARVLLADTSRFIHRLLTEQLAAQQIEVISAFRGADVLELVEAEHPDAVLLDTDLPDADGFEILVQLRRESGMHELPVIMLSSATETAEKVRAFDLGAIDFICKPFDIGEMKARLRSAVKLRRMFHMLAQRAQIDGLTGLYNRAYFDNRLKQEIAEAQRFGTRLSLILCDLDRFKVLNDTYGHPFGDHVLEVFAQIISTVRLSDIPCRYGGEEFSIVLPRASAIEAGDVANRFREPLAGFVWEDHPDLQVTASFGVADLQSAAEPTAHELVCAADRALYAAKQAGRNRVRIADQWDQPQQQSA